jgi:hypothetical protein
MARMGIGAPRNSGDNGHMRALRSWLIRALMTALVLAAPVAVPPATVSATPAAQAVDVDLTPARLTIYPLGTARVQMVLTNASRSEQIFAVEILLVRSDGSIVTAYLSDALALAPGVTATAIYTVRHADGAVEAIVTPRPWPGL